MANKMTGYDEIDELGPQQGAKPVERFMQAGVIKPDVVLKAPVRRKVDAALLLEEMAGTFRERNAVYDDNYKKVAAIMAILFPAGAPPALLHKDQFHLFELIIVKITRFVNADLQHQDSIHDIAIYAAMIEAIIQEQQK